jgi:undecaprenyl-diphosphatase
VTRATAATAIVLSLLSPVSRLDVAVRDAAHAGRSPARDRVMQAVTDAGRPETVLGTLLVIAVLDPSGVLTARRALLALVPANLVVEGLKRAVNRERPDGERKPSNAAFPSSHAANAAALAVVLARRWRRLAIPLALLAVAVCAARVLLDRHWLTDVVAGAVIGAAAGVLACRALPDPRRAAPRAEPVQELQRAGPI